MSIAALFRPVREPDLFNQCQDGIEPDWTPFNALEVGGCRHEPGANIITTEAGYFWRFGDELAGPFATERDANQSAYLMVGNHIVGGASIAEADFFTVYAVGHDGIERHAITDANDLGRVIFVALELGRRSGLPVCLSHRLL